MPDDLPTLLEILGTSDYALTLFTAQEIERLDLFRKGTKPYLRCAASGRDRPAKPEEIVRQLWIRRLIDRYGYAVDRIAVERPVYFGSAVHTKAADIVVFDRDDPTAAYIIVEVKKPKRRDGEEQLKSYCNAEGSPIGIWSNGGEQLILHREEPNLFRSLTDLPRADQTLQELLGKPWTYEDLLREDKLVTEQTTLKEIILSMENLVLANAGVDAFEEVFKLIYAKLYDEREGERHPARPLRFHVGGATPSEFYERIDSLFQDAKVQWPGVFVEGDRIDLSPTHLVTCGSFLEDVKLFNSNLQVIDEAFEYLSVEVGKGKKGQYFTPRHVIDMCVRMLGPQESEYIIDPAAGSCGFTVHSIFHVWGNQFRASGPEPWQRDYARERVFALDFDPRSIKIAKALNLIAGDGRSNVYRANTLDPRGWDDPVRVGLRHRLRRFPDDRARTRWNQDAYRYFDFDLVLTNPPFAGDISDSRMLHQYDIAKASETKWQTKVGRDLLFVERCFEFLKPGGRMAIVLPQGRFNNATDARLRRFIMERARVLAVVGLDVNTFKPHTGTKTSVLFVQAWNDDPASGLLCPRRDDYPIFFAASRRSGKDNSGEYIYRIDPAGYPLVDSHGHFVLDHDLDDVASAFVEFAKAEQLSFAGPLH